MSDLLTRLIEAGTPGHLVAEVAKELARAEVEREAIEARRAADRERQARRRSNVTSRDTADVTNEAPLSLPPNEKISNPPTHTPENNTTREGNPTKPQRLAKPDDVAEQTWRDFVRHRNAKKAPVTETALAGIRREAAKAGWTMDAALAETVTRGWQSFKADWAMPPPQGASAAPGSFLSHLAGQSP